MSEADSQTADNPTRLSDERIYEELLTRSGGKFSGDEIAIPKFELIYRRLHTIAGQIGKAYAEVSKSYGLEPGRIDVVLGGGRAKGNPFRGDSDLDLFFYIERPAQRLDSLQFDKHPGSPLEAMEEKNIKMRQLTDKVKDVCKEQNVPNEFHIMGYGSDIPEQYRKEDQLLLASVK